mmetsp:Transcript_884/g.2053  ORF Transcript_884/g.2053 Transcript_884/m.2053 type:complete len:250 (+) Transcript_884:1940-2689(+)
MSFTAACRSLSISSRWRSLSDRSSSESSSSLSFKASFKYSSRSCSNFSCSLCCCSISSKHLTEAPRSCVSSSSLRALSFKAACRSFRSSSSWFLMISSNCSSCFRLASITHLTAAFRSCSSSSLCFLLNDSSCLAYSLAAISLLWLSRTFFSCSECSRMVSSRTRSLVLSCSACSRSVASSTSAWHRAISNNSSRFLRSSAFFCSRAFSSLLCFLEAFSIRRCNSSSSAAWRSSSLACWRSRSRITRSM